MFARVERMRLIEFVGVREKSKNKKQCRLYTETPVFAGEKNDRRVT